MYNSYLHITKFDAPHPVCSQCCSSKVAKRPTRVNVVYIRV